MIYTVLGLIDKDDLGCTLMHEHILVGFIPNGQCGPDCYDRQEVIEKMTPYLTRLYASGCRCLVECTPAFLGRDVHVLKALSEKTGLHIITNTGYYQAPYLAPFVYEADAQALAEIWICEFLDGIDGTGIKPGLIKIALSSGNDPINPLQQKILHAAILTSKRTGLAIAAHTIGAIPALQAVDIIQRMGLPAERFIWIHAGVQPDDPQFIKAASSGCWVEIDHLSPENYGDALKLLMCLEEQGLSERILISQDRGWYNIGQPHGGCIHDFNPLLDAFVPLTRQQGVSEQTLLRWLVGNPARALDISASI